MFKGSDQWENEPIPLLSHFEQFIFIFILFLNIVASEKMNLYISSHIFNSFFLFTDV